ncbi:hypothetical protein KBZ21_52710, partial [Streptomyces sp. A73]|nr:hypothetical protein [Streptomyces sp. A73]
LLLGLRLLGGCGVEFLLRCRHGTGLLFVGAGADTVATALTTAVDVPEPRSSVMSSPRMVAARPIAPPRVES